MSRRALPMLLLLTLVSVAPAAPESNGERALDLVVSLGHRSVVEELGISLDGRLLLSRCGDGVVKLWDLSSDMLVQTWGGDGDSYARSALSPDGRWVATVRIPDDPMQGSVRVDVWDTATGKGQTVYPARPADPEASVAEPTAMAFSPDGRHLALATSTGTLDEEQPTAPRSMEDWTGTALHVIPLAVDGSVRSARVRASKLLPDPTVVGLGFAADPSQVLLAFDNGVFWRMDWATGKTVRETRLAGSPAVVRAQVSGDGTSLAVVAVPEGAEPPQATLVTWDPASGKQSPIRLPKGRDVSGLTFDAGAKSLWISSRDEEGGWHVEAVTLAARTTLRALSDVSDGAPCLVVEPRGRFLVTASEATEGGMRIRSTETGRVVHELRRGMARPALLFSADGRALYALRDGRLSWWDLGLRSAPERLAEGEDVLGSVFRSPFFAREEFVQAVSPAGGERPTVLLTRGLPEQLVLRVGAAPDVTLPLAEAASAAQAGFVNDGSVAFAVLSGRDGHRWRAWVVPDGRSIGSAGPFPPGGMPPLLLSLDLRRGAKARGLFAHAIKGRSHLELWDLEGSTRLWTGPEALLGGGVAVSRSHRWMAELHDLGGFLELVDLAAAAEPRRIDLSALVLARDGREIYVASDEHTVILPLADGGHAGANLESGTVVVLPPGSPPARERRTLLDAPVYSPFRSAVDPSETTEALALPDGVVELRSIKSGLARVHLVAPEDDDSPEDWVAFTPQGSYACGARAGRRLGFRQGARVFPLDPFDLDRNQPHVVLAQLGAASDEALGELKALHELRRKRQGAGGEGALATPGDRPTLELSRDALPRVTAGESVQLSFRSRALAGRLMGFRITANDVPLTRTLVPASPPDAGGWSLGALAVQLIEGANVITVAALDEAGQESLRERVAIVRTTRPAERSLFVVCVGVNHYADEHRSLEYAVKDSEDLARMFTSMSGPVRVMSLEGDAPVEVDRLAVSTQVLTDGQATRAAILDLAKGILAKASAQDTAILFFSGHGVLNAKGDYFFAPVDMDFSDPAKNGVSYAEIDTLLGAVAARRKILLMDSCHSGAAGAFGVAGAGAAPAPTPGVVTRPGTKGADVILAPSPEYVLAPDLLTDLFADLSLGSGAVILAASGGMQFAYESGERRNGLFTHALREAIEEFKADRNLDGRLSVLEIEQYVRDRVRMSTRGRQVPTFRRNLMEVDFVLR